MGWDLAQMLQSKVIYKPLRQKGRKSTPDSKTNSKDPTRNLLCGLTITLLFLHLLSEVDKKAVFMAANLA